MNMRLQRLRSVLRSSLSLALLIGFAFGTVTELAVADQGHSERVFQTINFEEMLVLKRKRGQIGLPVNHMCNSGIATRGYDNELAIFSPVRPGGKLRTLFRPSGNRFVGEMDLHFDADRLLFTMPVGTSWQVHEMRLDGTAPRQVSRAIPDVDNFDACYLPDGRIVFGSTAAFTAVPCWHGKQRACCLYLMNADGSGVRQLCFDQDNDLYPSVLADGRIIFSRWDYTGIHHAYLRPLMTMNPDGTEQRAWYGSNSYWPNSLYFPRAVPDSPGRVIAIVSGYHGPPRMGELVLLDVTKGSSEAEGVVQKIPGKGKRVETPIRDKLVEHVWPRFLHPYPINERTFLVACQPGADSPWGIYLADLDDNLVPLLVDERFDFFEPIPVRKTERPPVIPDRVDLERRDAVVYVQDVYAGDGLKGVPRGTIKRLRIAAYEFAYPGLGGQNVVGHCGPWEPLQILGTVPIGRDGSVAFRVPANMPLTIQALDAEGKAVQLMRSWYTAMPGESVGCVGCHEKTRQTPIPASLAQQFQVHQIEPWHGPARGFDFEAEVQPVLDQYCVKCHDGQPRTDGACPPDLRRRELVSDYRGWKLDPLSDRRTHPEVRKLLGDHIKFSPAYDALIPLIRRVNIEDDVHVQPPYHYHADTSELIQMLAKGHHGVKLDREALDRLVTWIDLNGPYYGSWRRIAPIPGDADKRRTELCARFGGPGLDVQDASTVAEAPVQPVVSPSTNTQTDSAEPRLEDWPFAATEARRRQESRGRWQRSVHLGDNVVLELVLIPRGQFVMGDRSSGADERPKIVEIDRDFWMGRFEATNEQFRRFAPSHRSGIFSKRCPNQGIDGPGASLDDPHLPVLRVSWEQAMDFCRWLTQHTGERFGLPTEVQWEYACRGGTSTPLWYGDTEADFSPFANLAGKEFNQHYPQSMNERAIRIPCKWEPRFDDHSLVTAPVRRYEPNPFGLYDMHGNAAEWTSSDYTPPAAPKSDARRKAIRGGSFHDRPSRCRAAFRWGYPSWQQVYNVGFRVVCEAEDGAPPR